MNRARTSILITCTVLMLAMASSVFGQGVINGMQIKGKVTDVETGEPLPFTNVFVDGKFVGTTTDMEGNYKLEVGKRTDSLTASSLGYVTIRLPLNKNAGDQVLNFTMKPDRVNIDVVTVSGGENPADVMLRRIIKNKDNNNYTKLPTGSYEAYTKYQIDLADLNAKAIKDNKLFALFPNLKNYLDTTTEVGNTVLPIFLIENLSDNYIQNDPRKIREVVKGIKMSGIEKQDFITNLLSNVNQNLNIYENIIGVMGKSLVSPIADYGLSAYKYDLNIYDTLYIGGEPHLEMTFKPKHKDDYAFKGKMIVNLKTFGIKSIDMTINEEINMGLIKDMSFNEEFDRVQYQKKGDSMPSFVWIPKKENLRLKFNYALGGDTKVIGKKTKSYRNFTVGEPLVDTAFSAFENTSINKDAYEKTDSFWDTSRHEELQSNEKGIYTMVDSLKRTTRFKVILYTAQTLSSGFARIGKGPIDIGPISSIISANDVEKIRLRLGLQTNTYFSKRVQLSAYAAYGFKDDSLFRYGVKGGGKVLFVISRKPWNKITLSARTDVDFKSKHSEEFDQDNVFTLVSKPKTLDIPGVSNEMLKANGLTSDQRLYKVTEFMVNYEIELYKDMTMYLNAEHRQFQPYFVFGYTKDGVLRNDVVNASAGISLKWQYHSKPLGGVFNRETVATKFFNQFRKRNEAPVVRLSYTAGVQGILKSDFNYHDLSGSVQGEYLVTARMSMYYNVSAGRIFGKVPFLLMRIPEGNFAFVHNKYFFNNMDLLEFAADRYASINWQYHFGGLLFDKIPGLRKLKWREVLTANVFWGDVTNENKEFNNYGTYYQDGKKKFEKPFSIPGPIPYAEAGFGIENIFKIIRLDSIWRITHRENRTVIGNWSLYLSLFIKV